MKRKEDLTMREGTNYAVLTAHLYVVDDDFNVLKEKAQDAYQAATVGSHIKQQKSRVLERIRGVSPSWFKKSTTPIDNPKSVRFSGKRLTLDIPDGHLESQLYGEYEGRTMIGIHAGGTPAFVRPFYQFLRETQEFKPSPPNLSASFSL